MKLWDGFNIFTGLTKALEKDSPMNLEDFDFNLVGADDCQKKLQKTAKMDFTGLKWRGLT